MKFFKKEKRHLFWISVSMYFTGLILYIFSGWIRVESNIGEQHHVGEFWIRIAHVLAANLALIALGYVYARHVLPGLPLGQKKGSGLSVFGVFVLLTLTSIGILYSGEGRWNFLFLQTHQWIGIGTPLLLFFHIARRTHPRKTKRKPPDRTGIR